MTLPRPRSNVVYKDLAEGAILFCTQTEIYFSLNSVGARIWQLLPPVCVAEEEIVSDLTASYPETDSAIIAADVRRLLDELVGSGLADSPLA